MMFTVFHIFLLLAPAFGGYIFPDDFQICKRNDEHFNECMLSATRDAWPKLADPGISSPITLKTEPLVAPYCEYHHNSDVFILDEYGFNLIHTGFINSTILSLNTDLANLSHNYTTFTPKMVQTSTYVINGTMLYNGTRDPEPIWGTGRVVKSLYNLTILHQLKGVIEERDGDKYIKVGSYATSALVDFITIEYENLYNGTNPEMAERAGSYINATAPYIMANMSHYVEDFLAGVFKSYTNPILESTPVSILFPID